MYNNGVTYRFDRRRSADMGKPEITRKNIILASIKLAKENGPSNVTVREICEEAGISTNT
ncbi:MAG: TetR/AcrR family transcriptional regulator, partial [Clostridia bacterium]|nr:TetR/AcrR family transcriptional regulator [Clostridia bacterium]